MVALGSEPTRLGSVHVAVTSRGVLAVSLPGERLATFRARVEEWAAPARLSARRTPLLDRALRQIREYFQSRRTKFDLPLDVRVPPFQQRVLRVLARVPFGATVAYGSLAKAMGAPRAARAVGAALARNPVPIVLGCHRVLAHDGSIGGFAGALADVETKRALLRHEGVEAARKRWPTRKRARP